MDSVTHAVSGAALLLAMPERPNTAWAVPLAMTVASIPDIDVFFSRVPVNLLLLHRGITHALPALPVYALLGALLMYPFWKRGTPRAWTFRRTAIFAFVLLIMHIWLDCVTSYGTLAFLPFSDYRVRLNGMFIVDLILLVPLVLCCAARRRPRVAAIAIIWLFLYSGGSVLWRMYIQHKWDTSLKEEGIAAAQLSVLPDAFSPLYWKVQYEYEGRCFQAPLSWNGERAGDWEQQRSADDILSRLSQEDKSVRIWTQFSLMPLFQEQDWEGGKEYGFYDWRFDTFVPLLKKWRQSGQGFRLKARVDATGKLIAVHYISARGNSGWQPPVAPAGRSGILWLIGLDN